MLSWPSFRKITVADIGTFLAIMTVAMMPIFSPRLPSVLLFLTSVSLVWKSREEVFASIAVQRLGIVFLLLWIPMLLSVPSSIDKNYSVSVAIGVAMYSFAGLALIYSLREDSKRILLAKWLTLILVLWIIDGFIQYLAGRNLLGDPLTADGRVTGFFRGNLFLSTTLAIFLPVAVWYLIPKSRVLVPAMIFASAGIAVLVATRNALMLMVVVVCGALWRVPRGGWLAVVAIICAIAAGAAFSPQFNERVSRAVGLENPTAEKVDHILSGRLTIWETAGRMVLDRPLTGVGIGNFASAYDHYATRPDDPFRTGGSQHQGGFHAHNVYVSIIAETGLAGLLGCVIAIIMCFKWYYAAPLSRRFQAWPYAFGLMIAVFPLSVEYGIFKHSIYPIVWLLLCATLAAISGSPTDKHKSEEDPTVTEKAPDVSTTSQGGATLGSEFTQQTCRICGNAQENTTYNVREMRYGTREEYVYFKCLACGCMQIASIPENLARYYPEDYLVYKDYVRKAKNTLRRFFESRQVRFVLTGRGWIGRVVTWVIPTPDYAGWCKTMGIGLDAKILDVGCGNGRLLSRMSLGGFTCLTGIDPFIRQDIVFNKNARVYKRDLPGHITASREKYDLVMLHHSFEHMPNPQQVLDWCKQLLADNGWLLIRVPLCDSEAWETYRGNWYGLDPPRHLFLHTSKSMHILLRQCGLVLCAEERDSTKEQFTYGELYTRDLPAISPHWQRDIFSKRQLKAFEGRARALNSSGRGDQGAFYIRKLISQHGR